MNLIELCEPNGTPTGFTMCGSCRKVSAPGNRDLTEKCCTCYRCGGVLEKEERTRYASKTNGGFCLYHDACEKARRAECDARNLEEATEVVNYPNPVYYEGGRGSMGDSYFANVDELAEYLDDEEAIGERPEFAHCCTPETFSIDIDSWIENACEDLYEDAADDLNGLEEFHAAARAFNEANNSLITWRLDIKRKVRIPGRTEAP